MIAALFVFTSAALSQVSQVLPSSAKPGDTLTVTYNPAATGANLTNPTSLVLHWGINEVGAQGSGNWEQPPQSMWPAGTVGFGDGKAAESPMQKNPDGTWSLKIVSNDTTRSIHYVFHTGTPGSTAQTGWSWSNNGNFNFYLVSPPNYGSKEVEFVFDPRSSSVNYSGTVDTVYLAGSFNSWANNSAGVVSNPAFAMTKWPDGTFRKIETLPIGGPAQYKFVIQPNNWYTDPDNPLIDPSSGNSVVNVDSTAPSIVEFSPASGTVFRSDTASLTISARVLRGSIHGINASTLIVTLDGSALPASVDAAGNISATITSPSAGRHDMLFTISDSAGATVSVPYAFGIFPTSAGYVAVDPTGNDNGPGTYTYPAGYASGSADMKELRIVPTVGQDSLTFVMKFAHVTANTGASIIITPSPSGSLVQDPIVSDLQEPDWQSKGIYIAIAPGQDTGRFNAEYTSRSPFTKAASIALNSDALTSDSLRFTLALSDLQGILGSFTGKWYIAAFSYLVDNGGNLVKIGAANGGSSNFGNPSVFDVMYLTPDRQAKLLSDYTAPSSGTPLLARLDNDGRGFHGVMAADMGLDYSGLPNVVILTQPATTHQGAWTVGGKVLRSDGTPDSSITSVSFYITGGGLTYAMNQIPVSAGAFSQYLTMLSPGDNKIQAKATNSAGKSSYSAALHIYYVLDKSPTAVIKFKDNGSSILVYGDSSISKIGGPLTYSWRIDTVLSASRLTLNPGATPSQVSVARPAVSGEYYFTLTVVDTANDSDVTRDYFTYSKTTDSVSVPTVGTVPDYVKAGRVYQIFVKSFTPQGTIAAAAQQLQCIKSLGYNIIWLMPIMKNEYTIDGVGAGYDITNFYQVAPEYGTMTDFQNFIREAHSLGLRVILDITPNHVSPSHLWVTDAAKYKQYSQYWDYLQHSTTGPIKPEPDGLSQGISADGTYVHYSDWALANLNWDNPDLRYAMLNVLKFWLNEGADGFRLDVYWGPHGRSGDANFDQPLRNAIKHRKMDAFILAEATGTGTSSEQYYADQGGGADAAYDRNLWNTMTNNGSQNGTVPFTSGFVTSMSSAVVNGNYYPGPDSYFLRYLENQDESRLAYDYSNINQTMPLATVLMTVPGIPMIYAGQEVGFGAGMDQFSGRRNNVVFKTPYTSLLIPHYEKLGWIRGAFMAFYSQTITPIPTGNGLVYCFARPYPDQSAITLTNFSDTAATVGITLTGSGVSPNVTFPGGAVDGKTYYMNDVYNGGSNPVKFSNGQATFTASLPAYGSAVYILSDSTISMTFPTITSVKSDEETKLPSTYALFQNYPNPFNPTTVITYQLSAVSRVSLKVYDVLGREVRTLVDETQNPGVHEAEFSGNGLASGVYFYKLTAGPFTRVRKMLMLK